MRKDRCTRTFAAAIPLLILIGFIRLPDYQVDTGVSSERFWTMKTHWPPIFDVVIAGDSRVFRGLSPSAMNEIMPKHRIANFGYPLCGLTRAYLEAVEGKLDPTKRDKVIVLGVTPASLTSQTAEANGFLDEMRRPPGDVLMRLYFGELLRFFRPIERGTIAHALRGQSPSVQYFQHFHADGWVATRLIPDDPQLQLKKYEELFAANQVSPELVQELLLNVGRWSAHGIRLFAFRPPTTKAMVELENRLSAFDEKNLSERFEAAGGTWLTFDSARYYSYDGSHIDPDSARQLSRDLAAVLVSHK